MDGRGRRLRLGLFGRSFVVLPRTARFDGVLHAELLHEIHRLPRTVLIGVRFRDDFCIKVVAESGCHGRAAEVAVVIKHPIFAQRNVVLVEARVVVGHVVSDVEQLSLKVQESNSPTVCIVFLGLL